MLLCVKTAVSSVALCASFPAPEMFGWGGRGAVLTTSGKHFPRRVRSSTLFARWRMGWWDLCSRTNENNICGCKNMIRSCISRQFLFWSKFTIKTNWRWKSRQRKRNEGTQAVLVSQMFQMEITRECLDESWCWPISIICSSKCLKLHQLHGRLSDYVEVNDPSPVIFIRIVVYTSVASNLVSLLWNCGSVSSFLFWCDWRLNHVFCLCASVGAWATQNVKIEIVVSKSAFYSALFTNVE